MAFLGYKINGRYQLELPVEIQSRLKEAIVAELTGMIDRPTGEPEQDGRSGTIHIYHQDEVKEASRIFPG